MLVDGLKDPAQVLSPGETWAAVKQHRKNGEAAAAISLLQDLCAAHPTDPRFVVCMAELLLQEGRLEDCEPYLERAQAVGGAEPDMAERLGWMRLRHRFLSLEKAGKPGEVIAAYHQVVHEAPETVRRIEEWAAIVNRAGQSLYQQSGERAGDGAQAIIEEVRQRGIAIRSFDQIVGDQGLLEELQAVARTTDDWTVPGKPHFFKAIREEEAVASHPIMRAGLHPALLEIANGFYELYTRLVSANIVLTRTDAADERQRRGSEGWHRDPEDTPMFKIFIYLNDVTELSHGPFQYVPASRPGGKYEYLMPRFGRGRYDPSYKTKPDWAQADREIDPADVVTVLGKAGAMFFCDTSGFHRGGYCTSQDRFMVTYVYQRPGSQYPSYVQCRVGDDAPLPVRMAVQPL